MGIWASPTLRERRRRRAERVRASVYEAAKVFVAGQTAELVTSPPRPAQPGVKRRLQEGDHVVFDVFHRGLVAGATSRLSALQPSLSVGPLIVVFGIAVFWIAGGPAGWLIVLVGTVATAAAGVFELRRKAALEEHGWLLTAEVTRVAEGHGWTSIPYPGGAVRTYTLTIDYRFVTPTGDERAGVARFSTTESARYPVPSPGDKLAILYADGITERVM